MHRKGSISVIHSKKRQIKRSERCSDNGLLNLQREMRNGLETSVDLKGKLRRTGMEDSGQGIDDEKKLIGTARKRLFFLAMHEEE